MKVKFLSSALGSEPTSLAVLSSLRQALPPDEFHLASPNLALSPSRSAILSPAIARGGDSMDPLPPPPPLPDDALAGVLRRLAPRDLAASRCVCRAWRRVVDDRRLLRADLLPRSLGGIFLNLHDLWFTQLRYLAW